MRATTRGLAACDPGCLLAWLWSHAAGNAEAGGNGEKGARAGGCWSGWVWAVAEMVTLSSTRE